MTLSDNATYKQVIGCLMINPMLLLEYEDIYAYDFDLSDVALISYIGIKNLYEQGATKLTPYEVEQEIQRYETRAITFNNKGGLEFLKFCYNFAEPENFKIYYDRLKKYSLLRKLKKAKYDISEFYLDNEQAENPLKEVEVQQHFEESSIEDILESVEGKFNEIRNNYLNGTKTKNDAGAGVFNLLKELETKPIMGKELEGEIFSAACRGAREGCLYLKSASTNSGKSRTAVFDACHVCYPIRWSHEHGTFIREVNSEGEMRDPVRVLFIVTEMDIDEIQTIMLAYLSGVDEDHILKSRYDVGEKERVNFAAKIMENYTGYFIIEEISEPNLTNVEAKIKKYATVDQIKYIWFDYIHTTASMMSQFSKSNLREDTVLMLMTNQLKQIARDYHVFIFSATQVNANAMEDNGEFKNEMCIRGSKAIADSNELF